MNIQHSKTRVFLYWNQPHNPAALTLAAVSVSAVTMTGTGPTLVPEQATPCAKTTKKPRLDKRPEVCRSPAPLDNSPCKYREPFPLGILWSNPEIRGNRTSTQQKHVLKNIRELFERTAKTLEILGLYKEGLCLLPGRIYERHRRSSSQAQWKLPVPVPDGIWQNVEDFKCQLCSTTDLWELQGLIKGSIK